MAHGVVVFAVNPKAVDRARDRFRVSGARSDPFDARVLAVREDGQLEVELVAVPKATFAAGLSGLGALASDLAGADVEDAAGLPLGVNLLPEEARATRQAPQRRLHLVFAGIALCALVFAAWRVLDNRQAGAEAFAARCAPAGEPANAETVDRAYKLAFTRAASRAERRDGLEFLRAQAGIHRAAGQTNADARALADFAQVLFSLNEFIHVD